MTVGIVEKKRFEPFYSDAECPEQPLALGMPLFSMPPGMGFPVGQAPYGLYGSVLNSTSTCRNPNQVKLTTKKEEFDGTLYLPDMADWTWGVSEKSLSSGKVDGSYRFVASISLKGDFVLPAGGTGSVNTEAVANAPLMYFFSILQAATLTGYVPLYTKSVAKVESCVKLFGMNFCDKKDVITWCGVLGGNCFTQFEANGRKMWVLGLCAYTKTICRMGGEKGEAEMKALVTAKNLGLTTIDSPCRTPPYDASMNCPLPQAPGINGTLHQVKIHGFVDGPRPDSADLEDGESMINLVTSLAIALGALGALCSCGLTARTCRRWKKNPGVKSPAPTPAPSSFQPAILTSQPQGKIEETTGKIEETTV